ncbi:hypothetical protein SAMD00019534_105140, partial [Acytostelium subglobosum LB1]|uniref:hypothetical protein n=1 Tax=Acytostelium subglobosum LB1 TaxID=1410327 RepID=UPI000644B230
TKMKNFDDDDVDVEANAIITSNNDNNNNNIDYNDDYVDSGGGVVLEQPHHYQQQHHDDNINSNSINIQHDDQSQQSQQSQQQYRYFLKLHRLNHGVSYLNIVASYVASFLSICFFVFINVAQPLILSNSLNIPDDKQGSVSGDLTFYNEIVVLLTSHAWGLMSDRMGRRIVYVLGLVIMGLGLGAYPFANHIWVLMIFRAVFAVGAAAASSMLSAVLGDYVLFEDRGKSSGLLGFCAGGGAVLGSLVLLKIPNFIDSHSNVGITMSAQLTYCLTSAMAFFGAAFLWFGLQRIKDLKVHQERASVMTVAKEGLLAGKNPILSLSYASGFIARGDSAIATTFLSLWIYQYALAHNGGNKIDALSKSGTITGIAQTFGLFFAPVAGYLCDKLNRIMAMVAIALLGCIGYYMLAFNNDPLSISFMVGACIIGCTETGMVVSSTALVAQESPKECRGSVGGFFSFCGAIGILIGSKLGGIYFDRWNGFPFALFGVFSSMLAVAGVVVYFFDRRRQRQTGHPAAQESPNISSLAPDSAPLIE